MFLSQNNTVLLEANLTELFESILLEVLANGPKISNHSYLYLLELLTSYGVESQTESEKIEEQMLSERLLEAIVAEEKREKVKSLKSLAETSLIKVGFFSPSLKRKIVGIRYHIDIGVMAYSHLYSTTKKPAYEEASERFSDYADILSGVREKINLSQGSGSDLMDLFEWFSETGSKKASQKLIDQGVSLISSKKTLNQ